MWRPKDWENPYQECSKLCSRIYGGKPFDAVDIAAFEAGADAMLGILREQGYDTMDSFEEEPYCSGKVVFIPNDEEDTNVGH